LIVVPNAGVVRNGQVGQIVYLLRDSNLLRLSSSGVVSVSSSSPAIAVSLDGSFFSTSVAAANTNSYGSVYFAQAAANTPGTANVTLSYNGTAVWTKSVTIVGAVKSIVITAGDTTGKTGVSGAITTAGSAIDATAQTATADAGTFTFVTKDAAGNLVGGQTVTADSSLYNASVSSGSQMTPVVAPTNSNSADVLKAIVSLIASINKQIAALQKALLNVDK
jgi:hypothetical protein